MSGTKLPALTDATIPAPCPRGYMYGTNVEINDALEAAMAGNKQEAQEAQITVAPGTTAHRRVRRQPVVGVDGRCDDLDGA
jgi:hypothetical protein